MQPLRGSRLRSIPLFNLLLASTLRIPARRKAELLGYGSPSGFYLPPIKDAEKKDIGEISVVDEEAEGAHQKRDRYAHPSGAPVD